MCHYHQYQNNILLNVDRVSLVLMLLQVSLEEM